MIAGLRYRLYLRRRRTADGCCDCGARVVRYLYIDDGASYPWLTLCQWCGRRAGSVPQVDLGRDRRVTVGNVDDIAFRFSHGRDRVRARLVRSQGRIRWATRAVTL